MNDNDKTKKQLIHELEALRQQVADLQTPKDKSNSLSNTLAHVQQPETRSRSFIDHKQVEEALKKQKAFLLSLQETSLELTSQLDLDSLLENIVYRAKELTRSSNGFITLIELDNDVLHFRVMMGMQIPPPTYTLQPGEGVIGRVWQTGKPLIVNDYNSWENRIIDKRFNDVGSAIAVPLLSEEKVIGVLGLYNQKSMNRIFDPEDLDYLTQFAQLATLDIENTRLFEQLQQELAERRQVEEKLKQQNDLLLSLQETSLELISQLDLDSLLENILNRASQLMKSSGGFLSLVESNGSELLTRFIVGMPVTPHERKVSRGEGIAGKVWQTGKPLILSDYDSWDNRITDARIGELGSAMAVPLLSDKTIIGILGLHNEKGLNRFFEPEDLDFLIQFAQLATLAIENARLFEQLQLEIAERVRVEKALRRSEEYSRQYFNQGLVGMVITTEGRWVEFNDALCDMFDYSREEFAKLSFEELTHPGDMESNRIQFRPLLSGEIDSLTLEKRYIRKDGGTLYAEISSNVIRNVEGAADHFVSLIQDITERKQTLEALRKSEKYSRQYFMQSLVGMSITLEDRSWVEFNDALCGMFGYSREEFAKQTWTTLTHPEDMEDRHIHLNRLLSGELDSISREKRYIRKDGSILYAEVSVNVIHEVNGSADHFVTLVQDVTEHKQTLEALRKSEEYSRQYFKQHLIGMAITSVDRGWIEFNDALCNMLGYPHEDFAKLSWDALIPPEDQEQSQTLFNRLLSGELDSYTDESRYIHRDGSILYAEISVGIVRKADGSVDYFVTLVQDLTEHKQTLEALRKSEERFRRYFELGLVGMAITSVNRSWIEFNDALCGIFGYSREEFAKLSWVALTPPEDQEPSQGRYQDMLSGDINSINIEKRYIHKDGSIIYTQLSTNTVRKADGSVDHFVSLVQDITERKQLEEQKIRQERLAAVGQLAAGIAHDFNNAMAVITLDSDMLLRSSNLVGREQQKLERIQQQALHSTRLVQQILDFSRSSVREPQQLDLRTLLHKVFEFVERTIPERIRIQFTYSKGDFTISVDPTQLQQVITNLAVNARDAIIGAGVLHFRLSNWILEADETPPTIEMEPGTWVKLVITDTGSGIASDDLPHIFEPFYTTKDVGKGTGLGLAQVYGIVKQHDGFITVDSQLGEGTTFTIYFPVVQSASTPLPVNRKSVLQQGQGETILLVEDNKALLDATRSTLESLNYRVFFAENGEDALIEYQAFKSQIDLILCDVVMPEMDGIELVRQLQQFSPPPKIVMMSGYPINTEITPEIESSIIDWLSKPLDVSQLANVLRVALH